MKKFIILFSIFLTLSLSTITINAFAEGKILTQGIYNARESNLLVGTPITARITSLNDKVMIMIIDSNQTVQELVRLGPGSTEHVLKPLDFDSSVIIFGKGSVSLS
ncbi:MULTISPECIES: hypothetical protein [unclassified Clostridium]|uniref:hypothetical protein n=1 Tax=unclassified Clostridium TaxID=2614128 RepID=UPI0002986A13|nr:MULTISPECIES: hypothetical protein [unclassified Clostridium]EKQ58043.1 MAG: hypothetical protein A370_00232 [Clostridium sp. Maddingley MBC34-26]